MEIVIKLSQFLLSLSLLIILHELGHFIDNNYQIIENLFKDPYFSSKNIIYYQINNVAKQIIKKFSLILNGINCTSLICVRMF